MNGVKCDMSKVRRERWYFEHNRNPKMSWIVYHISQRDGVMTFPPPVSPFAPPYPNSFHKDSTPSPSSGTRISPAVLFIIVILAVLFFISGILHLLVRFLIKHPPSSADADAEANNRFPEMSESDALQRQLQQLFHLHDSGLDQAFIDALPVFLYKEILGPKEPFDCAVCLSEFSEKDKLRLLPVCSHAFHINCIDAWLLSNSTCPLCRGTLFAPGFSMENPMFDIDDAREDELIPGNVNFRLPSRQKTVETEEIVVEKGVLPVRLGKFKRLNEGEVEKGVGETSSSNLDARRCFSMGSYQYVVGDSELRVALTNNRDGHDTKVVKGIEHTRHSSVVGDLDGKKICSAAKGDSFSVSKIWLWSKKGKFASSSDTELGVPSALNLDLPWMRKA